MRLSSRRVVPGNGCTAIERAIALPAFGKSIYRKILQDDDAKSHASLRIPDGTTKEKDQE